MLFLFSFIPIVSIICIKLELFINRRDDYAGTLFATDSEDGGRSHAYGRPIRWIALLRKRVSPGGRGIRCEQRNQQGRGSIYE